MLDHHIWCQRYYYAKVQMKNMLPAKLLFSLCLCASLAAPALAQLNSKGLPPTSMDSFVRQAAGNAELIYGDEGDEGPPPYSEFEYQNRINSGITGIRDQGLTTGHGSMMPSAWGRDEFLGAEWSLSGANGGNPQLQGPGVQMDQSGNPQAPANPVEGNPSYAVGPNWVQVRNPSTAQVMGYMAPGETYQQFFSGQSGHILPQFAAVGQELMNNPQYQNQIPAGPVNAGSGSFN
jgi:hypothetical protein